MTDDRFRATEDVRNACEIASLTKFLVSRTVSEDERNSADLEILIALERSIDAFKSAISKWADMLRSDRDE